MTDLTLKRGMRLTDPRGVTWTIVRVKRTHAELVSDDETRRQVRRSSLKTWRRA